MSTATSGSVFISYRRQETSGLAGRLYDRLADRFGDDQVFMDVDTIALGVDFAQVINQAVSTCHVLLAVIGPRWLDATDEGGRRRLEDPDDIVRLEIAAALERDIRVIPILVEGAVMPRRQELPDTLASLARRNALSVRHESFRSDADRLLDAIEPILHPPATPAPDAPAPARATTATVNATTVIAQPRAFQTVRHPGGTVCDVAFSPDGRLIATASWDKTARLWEVASGRKRPRERTRLTHHGWVNGVVFSPNGELIATASSDKTARVWEVASGQQRARLPFPTGYGNEYGLGFSPDGRLVAVADGNLAHLYKVVR